MKAKKVFPLSRCFCELEEFTSVLAKCYKNCVTGIVAIIHFPKVYIITFSLNFSSLTLSIFVMAYHYQEKGKNHNAIKAFYVELKIHCLKLLLGLLTHPWLQSVCIKEKRLSDATQNIADKKPSLFDLGTRHPPDALLPFSLCQSWLPLTLIWLQMYGWVWKLAFYVLCQCLQQQPLSFESRWSAWLVAHCCAMYLSILLVRWSVQKSN